jgi:hypothetical protein
MSRTGLTLVLVASLAAATPVAAQQQSGGGAIRVAPSGRATSAVTLQVPGQAQGAAPATIRVDYGQPHARGRAVAGGLVPYDQIWRTGANTSTTLTTDVDLEVGGARVPKGTYSLYSLLSRDDWKLVINRQTGQWGTQYDQAQDLARVELAMAQLPVSEESFTITLVPAADAPAHGTLVLRWGNLQGTVPWRVLP